MLKLMEMMKDAKIKFQWDIYTNATQYKCNYEEVHFHKQRYDIWDYLASSDYTVLLSDSEGLPYTVQESLQYQVPCIVTDVGGCTELIKDGVNGYVVPLDMNFDVNKIRNIPKCEEYDNHALEDWLKYLEYDGEELDKEEIAEKIEEEVEMEVRVRALPEFEGIRDSERNIKPKAGDEWTCSKERAEYLLQNGVIEIIEEIKPKVPEIKNIDEAIKKIEESAKETVQTISEENMTKEQKQSYDKLKEEKATEKAIEKRTRKKTSKK